MGAAPMLKRAYSAEEIERARAAAIVSGVSDAVLVVDTRGRPRFANPAFEALFGSAAERMLDFDRNADGLHLRAARGESFSGELEVGTPNGLRWLDVRTTPVRTSDGKLHGGIVVLTDRGDRRLLRLHEEFMALASHELRSPLTALGGFVEMLSRRLGSDLDERSRQHMVRAQAQVVRLVNLVNELTDLARLHSGKLTLHVECVDLVPLLTQIVDVGQTLTSTHTVYLHAPRGPVLVTADAQRLEQVLMNLIGNAVKYAPDCDRIDVRLETDDSTALLQVQDYGPGIQASDRESIFQRYFQARRNSLTREAGLGLGLYIAREIMLAHGGDLELRASSADGSIFSARLPLAR
jgi:signal transduction histidine kinase